MSPERGKRVYAVFEAVLQCDPAGRAALLEKLCAGDPELRAEVERLLDQDAQAERDRFLATRPRPSGTAQVSARRPAGNQALTGRKAWKKRATRSRSRRPRCLPAWANTPITRSSGNSAEAGWALSTWPRIG